jgi:stage III sporulation protein AB
LNTGDFLRLIAGGILALVSSYIGVIVKNGYRENTKLIKDLVLFCEEFKRELSYQKTSVIDFCNKFKEGKKSKISDLIEEYVKQLESVGQFSMDIDKWNLAHLKNSEKQEVLAFLNGLGKSPTEEQISFVERNCALFKDRQKQAEENEKKKGNMFFKLFVLLGVAIMVIVG